MWELQEDDLLRYRCHTGHSYSLQTLLSEQSDEIETAVYAAMRALEEKAATLTRLAGQVQGISVSEKSRLERQARELESSADIIRNLFAQKA